MDPIIMTIVAVLAGHVAGLLALWLRLRSRIQLERAHSRGLVAVARAMRRGGRISERRADGTHLTVAVTRSRTGERSNG